MDYRWIRKTVPLLFAVLLAAAGASVFISVCACGGHDKDGHGNSASPAVLDSDARAETGPSSASQNAIRVTFVELGSEGCIPCRMMKPIMEKIQSRFAGQVRVVYYDVWTAEGRPQAYNYGVRAIPTQIFLDASGKEFFRHEGFLSEEEIVRLLREKGVQ